LSWYSIKWTCSVESGVSGLGEEASKVGNHLTLNGFLSIRSQWIIGRRSVADCCC
jgi:hypothetical protein